MGFKVANVPTELTLAVPSKLTFQDKSPVMIMFLAMVNLSALATVAPAKLIPVLVTEVILPLASTANTGTVVADP